MSISGPVGDVKSMVSAVIMEDSIWENGFGSMCHIGIPSDVNIL